MKTIIALAIAGLLLNSCHSNAQTKQLTQKNENSMTKIQKSEEEWKEELSPEQYRVLRQCGTEPPGTGKYYHFNKEGKYICAACGNVLFDSETKYSSGSGWPSFYDVMSDSSVVCIEDHTYGMNRVEVRCAHCGSHLGHVFPDGPKPTGLRYCINSVSLDFKEKEDSESKDSK